MNSLLPLFLHDRSATVIEPTGDSRLMIDERRLRLHLHPCREKSAMSDIDLIVIERMLARAHQLSHFHLDRRDPLVFAMSADRQRDSANDQHEADDGRQP